MTKCIELCQDTGKCDVKIDSVPVALLLELLWGLGLDWVRELELKLLELGR